MFLTKVQRNDTLHLEGYSITFVECNGIELIIKNTSSYFSEYIEFSINKSEIENENEDSVLWEGAKLNLTFKYILHNKKQANKDYKQLIKNIKEAKLELKNIKYGDGLGMQWELGTKEFSKENTSKMWTTIYGNKAYLNKNDYPTIEVELIEYVKTTDEYIYEIQLEYRRP